MKRFLISVAAALALSACGGAGGGSGESDTKPIAPAAGSKWVETFATSAQGGYVMGNPDAPVKLVEYGALSCPVCARFSVESHEKLRSYIDKGTVSFEIRSFMVHPQDLPATLLARCNGAAAFFGIADQMFAQQESWMANSAKITPEVQQSWTKMTPNAMAADMAEKLELVSFVQQRGVPADKAKACLADPKGIAELEKLMKLGADDKVQGTPTFFINGTKVENTVSWADLEPKLKEAGA